MGLLWDIILSVLCVLGLAFLGWLLFGRLLRPAPDNAMCAVVPARGDGERLEQAVRAMIWLRGLGLLNCPVVLADTGLTPQGRALAMRLALRWPNVIVWPAEHLDEYIRL